ncbi:MULTISPECIES: hypothetical protein [unclassified Mesorhizobium]|uniref:hypothetical protein n=1 Tax=unclassified Mesorhizobium TaxID=325217 RepID=UPI000FEA63DE|nr:MULTISPECIES: hypothetical protein [unclassified Mesorhizobium]RWI20642.1 MAG: hypothetical protein EOQ92_20490 [Mesorhizobium sp.]RWK46719.1 MAG: hypothetical protein EOR47_24985 [Mesorhizobium sp.]RWK92409.1 MAG: hypothetical protein EOR53_26515 [Mesorhizobium sp.]RWL10099.1 MAG: hypothetical protein EOR45_08165 [Mesorhizobium sp.]TIP58717.1 MAG: hypothetical protein E5X56_13945 [Mesorhizobium sp.]
MASEVTMMSRDGNWKIVVEAGMNTFLFYSITGAFLSPRSAAARSSDEWAVQRARSLRWKASVN